MHPEVPGSFRDGYLWDEFAATDPELAATVGRCEHCMILRGTPTESTTLDYLRDTVGLITFLIDHGGCAVYDPFMFRWGHQRNGNNRSLNLLPQFHEITR
jgi:hypothetical protein